MADHYPPSNSLFRTKSIDKIVRDAAANDESHAPSLARKLRVTDLAAFGIAAIIGAGIFSTIGSACHDGGPAVVFLFIFTGIASAFSALCYAEFASRLPVAGSAYTYAYATFGELAAWIIGWALLMEYSIGNIAVAISWSGYFTGLMHNLGIHFPAWLSTDYFSARSALTEEAALAWQTAPMLGGLRLIADLPALVINCIITALVYVGIKESRNVSNLMVLIKIVIILLVISVGFFYVDTANWSPFAPNGVSGVMAGVAAVFFAYIGFDAVSTMAEECENPQRDLPRGMFYSLIICTILYICIALVLTGMVSYTELKVDDPLAFVFQRVGVNWISGVISVSALVAMTSVLLVFQLGQPRIWLSMSRDGLLPKAFSRIHPRFQTPDFATLVTGLVVGVPLLFLNYDFVIAFTSIGTLFAFVLVCGGALLLPPQPKEGDRFALPYINGKYIVPALVVGSLLSLAVFAPNYWRSIFHINSQTAATNIPLLIYFVICIVLAALSFIKNLSLIPVCGMLSCFYLLTGMTPENWAWFAVWLLIGLGVYFAYGYRHSKLAK